MAKAPADTKKNTGKQFMDPSTGPGRYLLPALLAFITFIVFTPVLSAYFVIWDDPQYLLENGAVKIFSDEWSWRAVKQLFTTPGFGNYVPLTNLSYAIECHLFAPDVYAAPFVFHLDNLLLHVGSTLCVFFLFRKLKLAAIPAFVGALLFGIHPMRVESVAWVTERKDVLYGLFFLLALIAYTNYVQSENGKRKWYVSAVIFSILACMAKVQAVSLPLCMVALDVYFKRRWYHAGTLVMEKLPFWLLSIAFGIANIYVLKTQQVLGGAAATAHYNMMDRLAVGAYTYMVYLLKFIYPYEMTAYYDYPVKLPYMAYVCIVIVPLLLTFIVWKWRKNAVVMLALLFFTFNVVFVLQILASGDTFMSDRYTYVAYTGLFFLVAAGYEMATMNFPRYVYVFNAGLLFYFMLFAYKAYDQARVWKNSVTLWSHYNDLYPRSYFGYYQLSTYYMFTLSNKWSDPDQELSDNEKMQLALENMDIAFTNDSLNGHPVPANTVTLLMKRGVASGMAKRYDDGVRDFTTILSGTPANKDALSNRALCYAYEKKYDLAIKDYKAYQRLDTTNSDVNYRCAICEGYVGRFRDGIEDVTRVIMTNAAQPDHYVTRARLYRMLNMPDLMHMDAQKARQMGGKVPQELLQ